ncbi:MAG: FAD-binding oxidoreductase, partial [Polyangiaceae bacterium]|nr:FAD-binding oxidoreductase [Polyangiaceae bacterium]
MPALPAEFVAGLEAALGAAHVTRDSAALERASTATFPTTGRVLAIARPASREEVIACVRLAREHRVALYPISTGKNWGLGSRVPPAGEQVLLDLGRMNRIVAFDEELAHVTVEPGVTFGQLRDFLVARGSRLYASSTGATPRASVIGNTLERGDGSGPHGDRVNHVCALEVVLGTGEVVRTGFARFGETPLAPLSRHGVGPALDGLFVQSRLGIVTQLTLWLTPLPRALGVVRFSIRDPERLGPLVDAVRALRLDGTFTASAGIWNDWRVLSTLRQYPWDVAPTPPLGRAALDSLAAEWGAQRWFGLAPIYAPSLAVAEALAAHVRASLAPLTDRLTIDLRAGDPRAGAELFHESEPAFHFLQGIPHEASLRSVYWRKRSAPPRDLDPERDRCGLLWACPAVPLRGAELARAVALCEQELLSHGFEPLLAFTTPTERLAYLIPLLVWDRDAEGDDERALA